MASAGGHALVLATRGRDSAIAVKLLEEGGLAARACGSVDELAAGLGDDVSFVVVAEEELLRVDLRPISRWIQGQPAWSDLPFLVLTQHGGGLDRNPSAARLSGLLGHASFVERPFHPTTFISVARSAMRYRARQHDTRTMIADLHDAQTTLHTALQAGRLATWELRFDDETLIAPDTFKAIFGRRPDDTFGWEDLRTCIDPEDAGRMTDVLKQATAAGGEFQLECRNVWPDGSLHWVELQARVEAGRNGVPARLVGVSADITARKRDEQLLRDMNETLEQRVAARSLELTRAHEAMLTQISQRQRAEEQLRQSQKMEMVGQLTGGVAHDFNNLLMVILTNLELMRRMFPSTDVSKRLIDGAVQSAKRGAVLTQRLLAFSRRQDLNVAAHDLGDLLRGMRDLLARSLGPRYQLELEPVAGLPPAMVDGNQVELAILNLAINARDAMPDGGRLSITLGMETPPQELRLEARPYLRLAVTDEGVGMDEDTLRRATEPFFSTKPVGKGTGLGLSMIHGLAEQLGGALQLNSAPGKGTTAELWLPAAPADTMTVRTAALREDDPPPMSPLQVLLVDDDALVAEGTRGMLESLGHTVHFADSGSAAIDCVQSGKPIDLMITDYSMPTMTGAQLATKVRDLRPRLPIILATGYADSPEQPGLDLPRLTKPYERRALAEEIRRTMTGAG